MSTDTVVDHQGDLEWFAMALAAVVLVAFPAFVGILVLAGAVAVDVAILGVLVAIFYYLVAMGAIR